MIHRWIRDQLAAALPAYKWSVNYYTGDKDTGTVYEEQGAPPGNPSDESGLRVLAYMVYLRGKTWEAVERDIQTARSLLHKRTNELIGENLRLYLIQCDEPIRVGAADDNRMEYSLNLTATLREV